MEIIRDYETEMMDAGKLAAEKLVIRAVTSHIITQAGADALLKEIWL